MTRSRRSSYKAPWDRGNGWAEVKAEWQDIEKSVDKTVPLKELKDLWCPASTSTISIPCEEIPGLTFDLVVGLKEYQKDTGKKRKPTRFEMTYVHSDGKVYYYPFIALPNADKTTAHQSAWNYKMSWSAAVRELINTIIPAYVNEGSAMQLWGLVPGEGKELPEMSESGEDQASAA